MNKTPQPSPRRRTRKTTFNPEALETRALLTGGAGNTFAIMRASVPTANVKTLVPFVLNTNLITRPHGQITLGIDVAPQTNSAVLPRVVGVIDNTTHRMIPISHTNYNPLVQRIHPEQGSQTTAVLVTLRTNPRDTTAHSYSLVVQGNNHTTGDLLVGFYLPGDATGDGVVDNTDLQTIKKAMGGAPGDTKYNFAADSNRDGRINTSDMRIAMQNFGVKVQISPVVSADLTAGSVTGIQDRITYTRWANFTGASTPGATVTFVEATNKVPQTSTVSDATGKYSINVPLGVGANTFQVTSVDPFGQTISGLIAPVTYIDPATLPKPGAVTG